MDSLKFARELAADSCHTLNSLANVVINAQDLSLLYADS